MKLEKRAKILIEAIPYIEEYIGETIVIKYGGNAMIDEELKQAVMDDLLLLHLIGVNIVLVHGGGPEISAMLKATGTESHFVNGLRYTDEKTMDIVQMVLCGKVNKDLCALLQQQGVGISGLDAGLFEADIHTDEDQTDYGRVGDIVNVKPEIVNDLLQKGFIPVISSVALCKEDGKPVNINADQAAAKVASALKARKLILLTDVPGLMRDPKDPETLIPRVKVSEVPALIKEGILSGGMIPKVECAVEAIRQGVVKANIQDGRIPHSILIEILSNKGIGTMFC